MSIVKVQGNASGTGALTIAAPNTNINQTLTLPDLTGTLAVNGPAFSATVSTNQSISANTATKVAFDTKVFDTNTNFSTANNRFTPTVAGYYQMTFSLYTSTTSFGIYQLQFYKNGALYKLPIYNVSGAVPLMMNATTLVYMNGSSDYLEAYWQGQFANTINGAAGATYTEFSGAMVRAA
jgi:hypothetical protein